MTHLDNSSLKNIQEILISTAASDMDTNSESVVSVQLDTSEPPVPKTLVNSVMAVLDVQKLATGNQS